MKRVEVVVGLRAPVDRVVDVLTDDPAVAFQPEASLEARGAREFRCGLAIDVADGAVLRHDVIARLGRSIGTGDGAKFVLRLEPAGHRHLLPVFEGELGARAADAASQLVLNGGYTLPLGVVGRLGDALAGHRSVERSLERLLGELAQRLDAAIETGVDTAPRHEATAPSRPSDYYLG